MRKYFEIAAWVAGFIFVVWAISFGAFWMVRSGCAGAMNQPQCNGQPLIEWYGNLVSLGWVIRYQELLAGIFALLAGASVLLAAQLQVEHNRRDTQEAQNERIRASLALSREAFSRAYDGLFTKKGATLSSPVAAIQAVVFDIAKAKPGFGAMLLRTAIEIEEGLRAAELGLNANIGPHSHDGRYRIQRARALAVVMMDYLSDATALFDDEGALKLAKKNPAARDQWLSEIGLGDFPRDDLIPDLYDDA